ncbi:ATPase [Actinoplanes sp. NPDC020271]|uniref:ATPase n=1 Tax=Actinoplanes sp. NPDC020271 TaxID=3363896 RepID=UPI0037A3422B
MTVRLAGRLALVSAALVHDVIGKAAAECPVAVVIDLELLELADPGLLSIFATASRLAQGRWGVPVLLYGADAEIYRELGVFRSFVSLHRDRWQALEAVRDFVPRWRRHRLEPDPTSVRVARASVGEACLWWDLRHVADEARLIVSELVTNAIVHAGTQFDVMVSYTGRFLRIAVQDGSFAMPRITESPDDASGWGLRLVTQTSRHWGAVGLPTGKIVWALLVTRPVTAGWEEVQPAVTGSGQARTSNS